MQHHQVNIIVEREREGWKKISWKDADSDFDRQINWADMEKIARSIGTPSPITHEEQFHLLKPITPKTRSQFKLDPEKQALVNAELVEQKKEIEAIEDPEKKAQALHVLESREKQYMLGLPGVQDRRVEYNPSPLTLFGNVFNEIRNTLTALVTGSLNPKWISGPLGIVQVVHDNWMVGITEALFWIGAISLNLGILNLLPIPMLDGGTILFCLFEIISGRRLSPKLMEKLIIPFAVLLIGFFIYLTYNDLIRIFGKFWSL